MASDWRHRPCNLRTRGVWCGCAGVQVEQLSIAPLLARLIEASHFRRHLYNEEAPVLDPESM